MRNSVSKPDGRFELERGCDFEERRRFSLAFKSYLIAAKIGNAEAQVNLANLYDEGKGCKRSDERAVYWYKRAVRGGSAEAAYNLGVHYQHLGSVRWARYWFERAAGLGDKDAKQELGNLEKSAGSAKSFPGAHVK
jgi:TPR repeat protein